MDKNTKILVIGGNGYIGSVLYDNLKNQQYDVDNVDLCWFGKIFEETLVEDYNDLTRSELSQYTHIVLLAGHSSVSMCVDLAPCFKNNVTNFINLIDKLDDKQMLIYASTLAVYGNNEKKVDELDCISEPLNYYDYTKICREQIAALYPNKNLVGLRFGTVGGFSPNFRSENLINSLSKNALLHNKITIANGDAYRTAIGVNDVSNCIQKLIEDQEYNISIYNLGSIARPIKYFGDEISRISGAELTVNESLFKTQYSFNCTSAFFDDEYGFMFVENLQNMYDSIIDNYKNIKFDIKRTPINYE